MLPFQPHPSGSTGRRFEIQQFSIFTFRVDFNRAATDLAIRGEALADEARVNRHRKCLAAERALEVRVFFHAGNLTGRGQSAMPRRISFRFAKRSAEHRLGKLELGVTFEPRRCSAFQNIPPPYFLTRKNDCRPPDSGVVKIVAPKLLLTVPPAGNQDVRFVEI